MLLCVALITSNRIFFSIELQQAECLLHQTCMAVVGQAVSPAVRPDKSPKGKSFDIRRLARSAIQVSERVRLQQTPAIGAN